MVEQRDLWMHEVVKPPWVPYTPYPFQRITYKNGERCSDSVVMRRKTSGGGWEYRPMTDDEYRDYQDLDAW